MTFSEFCSDIGDGQKVEAKEAFVISFTNTADEAFNIDPATIYEFLNSFIDNYDTVSSRWLAIPSRKVSLNIYEEKSYREIYKYFTSDELKVISSTGRSQTKALTQLIAKVISYLASETYTDLSENTFFEKQYVSLALDNWGNLFATEPKKKISATELEIIRERFRLWLLKTGQSERSAKSHSTTSINTSDKRLADLGVQDKSLLLCNSEEVLAALDVLTADIEWNERDLKGGYMYSGGVKKLAAFLDESNAPFELGEAVNIFKPFLLLAGISGTGKTRFVREQAERTGGLSESYHLTAVRPDWHEPGDVLGYKSRLSGKAEYIVTDILRFVCKAWCAIADAGVEIETDGSRGGCAAVGEKDWLENIKPYWLCLDEMNLAPVEQYFADYLSILETREWRWDATQFTYLCDPLLSSTVITDLAKQEQITFREEVGLSDQKYDLLWAGFCEHGIGIPFNLIVAGTVNMDETTHGFSRKVLDRALTIDFDEFFPNDFAAFFHQKREPVTFTYPVLSATSLDRLPQIDASGDKSITFLEKINSVVDNTPFKVAYRAVNELLLMVTCMNPQTDLELKAVWDDFLMMKVLSRIEGDIDKLGRGQSGDTVLTDLLKIIESEFSAFINTAPDMDDARPDLFLVGSGAGEQVTTGCRSKSKITWMQSRLEASGYTSFWP